MKSSLPGLLGLLVVVLAAPIAAQEPPPAPPPPPLPAAAQAPKPATADAPAEEPPPTASWVGNRFLQTSSPLVNDKGIFEGVFNHRFYQSVIESGGSRLLGLDNGAAVNLGMDYVPIRNLAIQVSRATLYGDYEFALKATLLRPTSSLPIAVGVRGGLNWLTANYFTRQSSTFAQLLVSATLANRVTIAAAPSFTQRTPSRKGVINVPLAMQALVTRSVSAIAEFVPKYGPEGRKAQWSFGIEKAVYHHKFALWIGNSGATTVDQMLAGDYNGGVVDSNIRIGFNVMRQFDLAGGAP